MDWNFDIGESEPSEKLENGTDTQFNETSKLESKSKSKTLDKWKDMFADSEA